MPARIDSLALSAGDRVHVKDCISCIAKLQTRMTVPAFTMYDHPRLSVDERIAANDACEIEHVISDETFEAIKRHIG